MKRRDVYVDLDGHEIALAGLDADERRLVARLRRRAQTHPDWTDFDNYWMRQVGAFYDARGVSRRVSSASVPVRIAQDLSSRLGIASGLVRPDDYRSELEALIREQFPSRRAFCEATGLAEEALSAFLAGRKDLPLDVLNEALERIGYRLHIIAAPQRKKTG
ncbi:MAG: hypothetical protein L0Z62_40575 [Gemmataceae bacterium]|nr:hypothetical protein [Gemmataceae bacterium]